MSLSIFKSYIKIYFSGLFFYIYLLQLKDINDYNKKHKRYSNHVIVNFEQLHQTLFFRIFCVYILLLKDINGYNNKKSIQSIDNFQYTNKTLNA